MIRRRRAKERELGEYETIDKDVPRETPSRSVTGTARRDGPLPKGEIELPGGKTDPGARNGGGGISVRFVRRVPPWGVGTPESAHGFSGYAAFGPLAPFRRRRFVYGRPVDRRDGAGRSDRATFVTTLRLPH